MLKWIEPNETKLNWTVKRRYLQSLGEYHCHSSHSSPPMYIEREVCCYMPHSHFAYNSLLPLAVLNVTLKRYHLRNHGGWPHMLHLVFWIDEIWNLTSLGAIWMFFWEHRDCIWMRCFHLLCSGFRENWLWMFVLTYGTVLYCIAGNITIWEIRVHSKKFSSHLFVVCHGYASFALNYLLSFCVLTPAWPLSQLAFLSDHLFVGLLWVTVRTQ